MNTDAVVPVLIIEFSTGRENQRLFQVDFGAEA
jgi:hypothetical protein